MAWFSRRKKDPAADHSVPVDAPSTCPADEVWVATAFDAYPVTQGNVLVVPKPHGNPTRVDTALADTAHGCQGAHTWPIHRARQAEQEGYEEFPGDGLDELDALVQAGLLRSATGIRKMLGDGQPPAPGIRLNKICLISCNRISAVQRARRSLDDHLRACGREDAEVIVVHDSGPDHLDGVLTALKEDPESPSFAPLRHFLPEGRKALAEYLIQSTGAPRETVEWGLGLPGATGIGPGGPNNSMLLLGAGNPLLFSDDDIVFDFRQLPEAEASLRLEGGGEADDYRFSPEPWAPFTGDHLAEHERWLGRPAEHLLRAGVPLGSMEKITAPLLARLENPGAHVALTLAGYNGDPGFGGPVSYLTLPESRAPGFWHDPEIYQAALRERRHLRVAPSPTVTGGHLVLSGAMAVDARALLPAFIPNNRGHDNAFGSHILATDPGALFAALPVAAGHQPEDANRPFPRIWEEPWPRGHGWLSNFEPLRWLWTDFGRQATGSTVPARLLSMARQWEAAGTELPEDHLRRLRRIGLAELQSWAAHVDKRRSQAKHPAHRHDLELLLQRTTEMARDPWFFLPGGAASSAGFVAQQQNLCRRFGTFLRIWPDLWNAAQGLSHEERLERFARR